jgi:hypothetical protein
VDPFADRGFGFAFDGPGEIYNEVTFRHFLALERKRAEQAGRPLLLMLVSFSHLPQARGRMAPTLAARVFSGLGACVREVDFIGWYRDGQVAGAVLAQGDELPRIELPRLIAERVTDALQRRIPRRLAGGLHVRVLHVHGNAQC